MNKDLIISWIGFVISGLASIYFKSFGNDFLLDNKTKGIIMALWTAYWGYSLMKLYRK